MIVTMVSGFARGYAATSGVYAGAKRGKPFDFAVLRSLRQAQSRQDR